MNRRTVVAVAVFVALVLVALRSADLRAMTGERGVRTALVYDAGAAAATDSIRAAYAESLREAGIPFDWIAADDLSLFGAAELRRMYAAIVFPDTIDERIGEEAVRELTRYANDGGLVAIVGDAGTRTADGTYRPASLFATVSSIDAMRYRELRATAFGSGPLHFRDAAAAERWHVPSGKLIAGTLSGYQYGPLRYPFARATIAGPGAEVDAWNGSTPLLARRTIGRGEIAYIAIPLGYLRGNSDAFPMTFLTSFLTSRRALPHLIATPDGVGALVVNLHIDSSVEFLGIPNLVRRGLLRHDVHMEFDVTAGPDLDRTGDGLGFAACERGPGRTLLSTLMRYGTIGSHGGWAHNLFADHLAAGRYTRTDVRTLVDRNDRCLTSVTGYPVRSYAAPAGVDPQPVMTAILDGLGIAGYYYTGDSGGPAVRPFFAGRPVSARSWAFPVMPFGRVASIGEMRYARVPGPSVERWLAGTAEYAAAQRGIFLVYSHSYDLLPPGDVEAYYDAEDLGVPMHVDPAVANRPSPYAAAFGRFLDRVEGLERAGRLRTTDMPAAAAFEQRFIATTFTCEREAGAVHVVLHNAGGLHAIAFALPAAWLASGGTPPPGVRRVASDAGYVIFTVVADARDLDLTFNGAS